MTNRHLDQIINWSGAPSFPLVARFYKKRFTPIPDTLPPILVPAVFDADGSNILFDMRPVVKKQKTDAAG